MKKNCNGELIVGKREFRDPSYGFYGEGGEEHVNWNKPDEDVDEDGFDKHHKEPDGQYKQDVILPYGKLLCRYGPLMGRTTTDYGTPYENISLPYIKETVEYHIFRVIADGLIVQCIVTKGKTAPMFEQPGGAVQYKHYQSLIKEVESDKLEEVDI